VWRLLKAEIVYNMPVFSSILLTSLVGFLGLHFYPMIFRQTPANMNTGFIYLSLAYFFFVMALLATPWAKEKRPRQLVCLPVSVRRIGRAHLSLHLVYWLAILALFFLWTGISKHFSVNLSVLVALGVLTGVSFFVYSLIAFTSRFKESVGLNILQIGLILLFGFVVAAGAVHTYQGKQDSHIIDNFLSWTFQSPISSLVWLILGLGLSILMISLSRAKSYAG
jgi:hypothetical protein